MMWYCRYIVRGKWRAGVVLVGWACVACGSRTALDVPTDASVSADATADVARLVDAAPDVVDAGPDTADMPDAHCVSGPVLLSKDGALQHFDPDTLAVTTFATLTCGTIDGYGLAQRPDGAQFAVNHIGDQGGLLRVDANGQCAPITIEGLGGFPMQWVVSPAFVGNQGAATPMWLLVHSWADGSHGLWRWTSGTPVVEVPGFGSQWGRCKLASATGRLWALCLRDGGTHTIMELATTSPTAVLGPVTVLPGVTALFAVEGFAVDGARAWVFTASQFASQSLVQRVDLTTRAVTELGHVASRVVGAVWDWRCP